jgi:hypothetical protein
MKLREYISALGLLWSEDESHSNPETVLQSPLQVEWSEIGDLSERELESAQAILIALRDHFPSLYRQLVLAHPDSRRLLARRADGRTIKLRRIAIARLAASGV